MTRPNRAMWFLRSLFRCRGRPASLFIFTGAVHSFPFLLYLYWPGFSGRTSIEKIDHEIHEAEGVAMKRTPPWTTG